MNLLKKRHSDVEAGAAAVGSQEAVTPVARSVGQDGWEASHEQEKKFLETGSP